MLLIAGKGHETGQIVGSTVLPFSDHEAVRAALSETPIMAEPLWQWDELVAAAQGHAEGTPARRITGFSIDTRSWSPATCSSPSRTTRDGHEFVPRRLQGRRGGRHRRARATRRQAAAR